MHPGEPVDFGGFRLDTKNAQLSAAWGRSRSGPCSSSLP